mmetsp:Transcript_48511/g.150108  ORF Transcript_48511/g.150108 Transcript_48511/m.150108 type:complete len:370 (+) Transcript_48511:62-1171(+)
MSAGGHGAAAGAEPPGAAGAAAGGQGRGGGGPAARAERGGGRGPGLRPPRGPPGAPGEDAGQPRGAAAGAGAPRGGADGAEPVGGRQALPRPRAGCAAVRLPGPAPQLFPQGDPVRVRQRLHDSCRNGPPPAAHVADAAHRAPLQQRRVAELWAPARGGRGLQGQRGGAGPHCRAGGPPIDGCGRGLSRSPGEDRGQSEGSGRQSSRRGDVCEAGPRRCRRCGALPPAIHPGCWRRPWPEPGARAVGEVGRSRAGAVPAADDLRAPPGQGPLSGALQRGVRARRLRLGGQERTRRPCRPRLHRIGLLPVGRRAGAARVQRLPAGGPCTRRAGRRASARLARDPIPGPAGVHCLRGLTRQGVDPGHPRPE